MPAEAFINRNFSTASLALIERANEIIVDYKAQGFTLTLRQLYYQFVARDLLPNKQSEYKRLGSVINDGRLAGLIDWDAIEDRTRNIEKQPSWDTPNHVLQAVANQYRNDPWDSQPYRVEVWVEKEALIGVVEPVCQRFRIAYFACRGYTSQSEQWRAGKRLADYCERGQNVLILHLGDHDPSGIDMTRDNRERLELFARLGEYGQDDWGSLQIKRIALNMDQVGFYRPPPNPAKMSDSRFDGYAKKFGAQSWELDALSPTVIDELISNEIDEVVDDVAWEAAMAKEAAERTSLSELARTWGTS